MVILFPYLLNILLIDLPNRIPRLAEIKAGIVIGHKKHNKYIRKPAFNHLFTINPINPENIKYNIVYVII